MGGVRRVAVQLAVLGVIAGTGCGFALGDQGAAASAARDLSPKEVVPDAPAGGGPVAPRATTTTAPEESLLSIPSTVPVTSPDGTPVPTVPGSVEPGVAGQPGAAGKPGVAGQPGTPGRPNVIVPLLPMVLTPTTTTLPPTVIPSAVCLAFDRFAQVSSQAYLVAPTASPEEMTSLVQELLRRMGTLADAATGDRQASFRSVLDEVTARGLPPFQQSGQLTAFVRLYMPRISGVVDLYTRECYDRSGGPDPTPGAADDESVSVYLRGR